LYSRKYYYLLGAFAWLSPGEIESLDVININDEDNAGYILEVDLGRFIYKY
jgi:hypothetical protein